MNDEEFFNMRNRAKARLENMIVPILALELQDGNYIDIDCYDLFYDGEQGHIYQIIVQAPRGKVQQALATLPGVVSILDEQTREFEMSPGDIVPTEGVCCARCGAQLIEPCETENA